MPRDKEEPLWWPTFNFAQWDDDEHYNRVLTDIQTRLGVTRYQAWMLCLQILNTTCQIVMSDGDGDDEPWHHMESDDDD